MKASNGNEIERYEEILPLPKEPEKFFQHIPGVYCRNCGQTFALYSYSKHPVHGTDENDKPFYNMCFNCMRE